MCNAIIRDHRRTIFDAYRHLEIAYFGDLKESAFLQRLYNLSEMPSADYRFSTAQNDIEMHRELFRNDWDDDWLLYDDRFNLIGCRDEMFLAFLCETLHPSVRSNNTEVEKLLELYNSVLNKSEFIITLDQNEFGVKSYTASKTTGVAVLIGDSQNEEGGIFNFKYIRKQITRMKTEDPELAIGTAKELIESTCKTILSERKLEYTSTDDIPKLVKKVFKILYPNDEQIRKSKHAPDCIRILLSNLASLAVRAAELRNIYGTGHGKPIDASLANERIAKLAVNSAITLVLFIWETHSGFPKEEKTGFIDDFDPDLDS